MYDILLFFAHPLTVYAIGIVGFVVFAFALAALLYVLWPSLSDFKDEADLKGYISLGFRALLVIVVIVAVIWAVVSLVVVETT